MSRRSTSGRNQLVSRSSSLGAALADGEEDEALELAAAVRARFVGGMVGDVCWGGNERTFGAKMSPRVVLYFLLR